MRQRPPALPSAAAWAILSVFLSCGPQANPLLSSIPPAIEGEPVSPSLFTRQFYDRSDACEALCALTFLHCKQEKRAYPSFAACMDICPHINEMGSPGDLSGDSVQCRLTYALMAEHTLTLWFCQNASSTGGLQCR